MQIKMRRMVLTTKGHNEEAVGNRLAMVGQEVVDEEVLSRMAALATTGEVGRTTQGALEAQTVEASTMKTLTKSELAAQEEMLEVEQLHADRPEAPEEKEEAYVELAEDVLAEAEEDSHMASIKDTDEIEIKTWNITPTEMSLQMTAI